MITINKHHGDVQPLPTSALHFTLRNLVCLKRRFEQMEVMQNYTVLTDLQIS